MLILLAEDDEEVRVLLYQLLLRSGHDVLVAADGIEALHVLAAHSFDVDVVLTDLDMPRLDGRELTARLADRAPQVRVIQMTGGTEYPESPPGVLVLLKPFPLVELKKLL